MSQIVIIEEAKTTTKRKFEKDVPYQEIFLDNRDGKMPKSTFLRLPASRNGMAFPAGRYEYEGFLSPTAYGDAVQDFTLTPVAAEAQKPKAVNG